MVQEDARLGSRRGVGRRVGRRGGLSVGLLLGLLVVGASGAPSALAALPTNSWLGLKALTPATGAMASCALSALGTNSVWAAVTGTESLDIVQVGAVHTATGNRWFAAWGRGEPRVGDYTEVDLGPTDAAVHKYSVQLVGTTWILSIDGRTRLELPDDFRTWIPRAAQVQNEVTASEAMGPASCSGARVRVGTKWSAPVWAFTGTGGSAGAAAVAQGRDWFRVTDTR